jgi:hypothetical protein
MYGHASLMYMDSGGESEGDFSVDDDGVRARGSNNASALDNTLDTSQNIAALPGPYDKEYEDARKRRKRAQGVTPSALGANDDWLGVYK